MKYRDVRKLSAILLGLFLLLCTSTIIASIFFGLASSKTIEYEVKIKTVVEGNTFLLKKVKTNKWDIYVLISESFYKSDEITEEESINKDSCKGNV